MAEFQGTMAGVGDVTTRTNEITPEITANGLRNIRGFDYGILKGAFNEFNLIIIDNNRIEVQSGQAQAYSYDGYRTEISPFNYPNTSGGTKYYFIYLEWDRSVTPNTFKTKDFDNQNSETKTDWVQDDLRNNLTGIFQMPIWLLQVGMNGIAIMSDLRILKNGVNQSQNSTNAINAPNLSQTINDTRIANTAYVRDAINNIQEELVWDGNITSANNPTTGTLVSLIAGKNLKKGDKIRIMAGSGNYYGEYFGGIVDLRDEDTTTTYSGGYSCVSFTSISSTQYSFVGVKPILNNLTQIRIKYHRVGLGVGESIPIWIYKQHN